MRGRTIAITALVTIAVGCNEHPVSTNLGDAIVEMQQPTQVAPSEKLDLLWVIDNSGSMCQEQAVLRDNFDRFIEELDRAVLDFHIGVTTTHMEDDYPLEPVARPGYLQSTPQPLPGFDESCYTAVDDDARPIAGDYTPIRQLIDAAVDCMREPDQSLAEVSDADIECALDCNSPGMCRGGEGCGVRLFPETDQYRTVPKVLRSEAYRDDDGTLDVDRLQTDFACMSLVGMRGFGFEKGLGAVVEAVSPELTGGTVENPIDESAPNHGFIRSDARFAAVFVTDENDCTHDGSLTEVAGSCGDDTCEYWNHPDLEGESALVEPDALHGLLIENLGATKSEPNFDGASVLAASIHGRSKRYDGPIVPTEACRVDEALEQTSCEAFAVCDSPDYEKLRPSCASKLGESYSGDRYERFLRSFGEGHYYPTPNPRSVDDPLTGWMCTGDFRPALESIGEFLRELPGGCITQQIQTCDPDAAACPDHSSGEPGRCISRPNSGQFFCDSHVQLRVRADATRLGALRDTGYCSSTTETGECVVGPGEYTLGACSGGVSGVKVEWGEPAVARQVLAGTELEVRWVSTSAE